MKKTIHYEFEQGSVLSLQKIAGRNLRVVTGQVWLTESSQAKDIVIEQQGCYRPSSNQLIVLEALRDSQVEMDLPASKGFLHFLKTRRTQHWTRSTRLLHFPESFLLSRKTQKLLN